MESASEAIGCGFDSIGFPYRQEVVPEKKEQHQKALWSAVNLGGTWEDKPRFRTNAPGLTGFFHATGGRVFLALAHEGYACQTRSGSVRWLAMCVEAADANPLPAVGEGVGEGVLL